MKELHTLFSVVFLCISIMGAVAFYNFLLKQQELAEMQGILLATELKERGIE